MVAPLIVVGFVLLGMLVCIVTNFKIKIRKISFSTYWVVCLIGAIICICCGFIHKESLKNVFISSANINPVKILVIFLSCTSLSILLDQIGFFRYIAQLVLKKAKSSQVKLFFAFSFIIAILTIFTSNDILILTFTPFICYFTKRAKIDPTPYLVVEFICANVWSMFFYIDNPTNIYLCTLYNISFVDYVIKMALPTLAAGLVAIGIVYLLFMKKLKQKLEYEDEEIVKPNKNLLGIGLAGLGVMVLMMIISPYLGLDIWYVPLICAGVTYITVLIYLLAKKESLKLLWGSLKNLPYELIPFLISMAILVSTLQDVGFIDVFGKFISSQHIIVVGLIAFLIGNLINNIPMSMFFASTLATFSTNMNMVYAVVVASNICAFLTPVGALAGIMYMKILKENDVKFSFLSFIKYGTIVAIPTIFVALGLLLI